MAFTNGAVPNVTSLIDAFRSFAVANGWTNNRYLTEGTGKTLSLSKSNCFMNLRALVGENPFVSPGTTDVESVSNATGLWLSPSTGFDNSAVWFRQPNAPYIWTNPPTNNLKRYVYAGITDLSASMNYWFFAYTNAIYAVVEIPAGRFHWFGFGNLQKFSNFGGGQFLFAKHSPNSLANELTVGFAGSVFSGVGNSRGFLRANNLLGSTGWATNFRTPNALGNLRPEILFDSFQKIKSLWQVAPQLMTSQPLPIPVGLGMTLDSASLAVNTPHAPFGIMEGLNFMNIYGLTPGSEFPDGTGAVYRVFPMSFKLNELPQQFPNYSSGTLGIALKAN